MWYQPCGLYDITKIKIPIAKFGNDPHKSYQDEYKLQSNTHIIN